MNKRIALVAAAVLLAVVGTFAVYSYARNADRRAVAGTRATTVLVATKRVPAGTTWADAAGKGYLSSERMPAGSAPASSLTSTADAAIGVDAVAQADIAPGQIVLREAFGARTAQTGVLAIPAGKLAISVSLSSDADVAGYVGPGSQVVIFMTAKLNDKAIPAGTTAGDDLTVTRTVASRVSVIASSQSAPTGVAGSKSTDASASLGTVLLTLAVTQQDAQRIILAQKTGELYLGLLSTSSVVTQDPGVVNAGVFRPVPIFVK